MISMESIHNTREPRAWSTDGQGPLLWTSKPLGSAAEAVSEGSGGSRERHPGVGGAVVLVESFSVVLDGFLVHPAPFKFF